MSRLARRPIPFPNSVSCVFQKGVLSFSSGAKNEKVLIPDFIKCDIEDSNLKFSFSVEVKDKARYSMLGTVIAHSKSAIKGVTEGYKKQLELKGVGYKASLISPNRISLSIGYSDPVEIDIIDNVCAKVEKETLILLESTNACLVGTMAAKIIKLRPPSKFKRGSIILKKESNQ